MRKIAAFLIMVFVGSAAFASPSEEEKIHYLLNQLTLSNIVFIRNGQEHSGAWAKTHLEQKMQGVYKPGMTAEEFIINIGSKSSHSDKPYRIMLKDGRTIEASKWFFAKLADMPK